MPFDYSSEERLHQMYKFSNAYTNEIGKKLRASDQVFDVATFAYNLGAEKYARFWNNLQAIFPQGKTYHRKDVVGIAKTLEEFMLEKNCKPQESWLYLTDLVGVRIYCKDADEVMRIWHKVILPRGNTIAVLRITPRFAHYFQDMVIAFCYSGKLIGELRIKLGEKRQSRGFNEQKFVYECLRATKKRCVNTLNQVISDRMNDLADSDHIFRAGYTGATHHNPQSVQGMMKDKGQDHQKDYDGGKY